MDNTHEAQQPIVVERQTESPVERAWAELSPMVRLAKQYPRDTASCIKEALNELDLNPEFAHTAYYSIPYAKHKGSDEKVFVEGPSIRASMAMCRHFGNCITNARIIDETDERVVIEGRYFDLQGPAIWMRPISVTRKTWSKQYKKMIPMPADRFNIAIQAGVSKAIRNAVLNGLPVFFVQKYFKHAKEIVAGHVTSKKSIRQQFKEEFGVTEEMITKLIRKKTPTKQDIATLNGLLNALRDGTTTVEEAFGGGSDSPEKVKDAETEVKTTGLESPFKDKK